VRAIAVLALALPFVVACAGGSVQARPTPGPTPAGREVVVPFVGGGSRDVFPRVGDVVVVDGGGTVVTIAPSGTKVVRQVGPGARFAVAQLGLAVITVSQGGEPMTVWIRSYLEWWQPYDVAFVNGSSQVVYPVLRQVIVVDGGGTASISPPGIVRQEGADTRFVVERAGRATITIQRGDQRMVISVQSIG
jgi:hypothetical protein